MTEGARLWIHPYSIAVTLGCFATAVVVDGNDKIAAVRMVGRLSGHPVGQWLGHSPPDIWEGQVQRNKSSVPKPDKEELHLRARFYRKLAAVVSDGNKSKRLSRLARRFEAEAEAFPNEQTQPET